MLLLCPGPPKPGVSACITSGPLAAGEQQVWLLHTPEGAKPASSVPVLTVPSQTSSWQVLWLWESLQAASSSTGADGYEPSLPSFAVQCGSALERSLRRGKCFIYGWELPLKHFSILTHSSRTGPPVQELH